VVPTVSPSVVPSVVPTVSPSVSPTVQPTAKPTTGCTCYAPTKQPTVAPTSLSCTASTLSQVRKSAIRSYMITDSVQPKSYVYSTIINSHSQQISGVSTYCTDYNQFIYVGYTYQNAAFYAYSDILANPSLASGIGSNVINGVQTQGQYLRLNQVSWWLQQVSFRTLY
jgi:hypothetical protein